MPEKRRHNDPDAARAPTKKHQRDAKHHKGGFQVGPANLPDGTHRRKVLKIKQDLIHKAKIKKQYAKLKERELNHQPSAATAAHDDDEPTAEPASLEPHPDRQKNLEKSPTPEPEPREPRERRPRKQRTTPYAKEAAAAQKRKEEAEERRRAREEAERQKQERLAEREKFRKAMAKARGAKDGKRRLGREAPVLLDKIKRLVGQT
ncbi:uncharacterized protein K452DRAFT_362384 [Aplosporella prunicola CBS 121167]|uniref:Uncharacterized protein n=1 Tax=Aplosporella prunicola CBS 121167 TaxID=1176127 RepID=A0A6A6AZU7_9PEZI|nr:uncharacterized protein K452DRAFT_362384 [Aplosporella prunicola CBS 121167]KAF2136703.1 hypothetical protein K452DRAFT_362384 [Aplosporella prunicola CBS 121167]